MFVFNNEMAAVDLEMPTSALSLVRSRRASLRAPCKYSSNTEISAKYREQFIFVRQSSQSAYVYKQWKANH